MPEIPLVATYRLQLTPTFGLDDAARLVPYLAQLGISHVYTSSYLQAAPGSTHGYDVVDPAAVNVELGGEDALARFHDAVRRHGLGNVVDVVPNHMAVGTIENRLWWDVLRCGQDSAAARYFDIDWQPPESKLAGKILLPVLGGTYAQELASGSLQVVRNDDGPELHYADHRFPIDPRSLSVDEADSLERFEDQHLLHELIERQHYRLASWKIGRHELNYRRFFEVNTLAGVRVEDPVVFDAVHQRTLEWFTAGHVQGLRIDHPDGLRDPGGYLDRLRRAAPDAWIVVEKILEPGESLPDDWPVDGTTGYDAMHALTAVFVPRANEAALTDTYASFTGDTEPYDEVLRTCKTAAVRELLATEVTRLTNIAAGICERSVDGRDVSRRTLQAALEAILVAIPVYRTYVVDRHPSAVDRTIIDETIETARAAQPAIDASVFEFIAAIWSGEVDDDAAADFVARLQQLSGPAMAKGAEDTAFYRYQRLVALNEVGSDPATFGIDVATFHATMVEAAVRRATSMVGTSTHDTKRSEDVRCRIALLAELPSEWHETVMRWRALNEDKWTGAPDRNVEYLLYQTLVGAHPLSADRAVEFATKAIREAKRLTSWLAQDPVYEASVEAFIRALDRDPVFRADLDEFVASLTVAGRIASLAQTLLKITVPGVPDFYQGAELWTTSLVDPDNRTPVDYSVRDAIAADESPSPALVDDHIGTVKLRLIQSALGVRRSHPRAFSGDSATYEPLELHGAMAGAVLGFMRGTQVITVATVRPVAVEQAGWGDTSVVLPPGRWVDALTGHDTANSAGSDTGNSAGTTPLSDRTALADLMHDRAVALLVREDGA